MNAKKAKGSAIPTGALNKDWRSLVKAPPASSSTKNSTTTTHKRVVSIESIGGLTDKDVQSSGPVKLGARAKQVCPKSALFRLG